MRLAAPLVEAVENGEKGKNGGKRSRKTSFFTLFLNFFEKILFGFKRKHYLYTAKL